MRLWSSRTRCSYRRSHYTALPPVAQLQIGGERATMLNLPAVAKVTQLLVAHAHVHVVALNPLGARQLGARPRVCHALKHIDTLVGILSRSDPAKEALEVALIDAADRIDIGRRAVVLCVIASQRLIDVCRAENEERAAGRGVVVCGPWHELCEEVAHHHARARLNVLERKPLTGGAALVLGPRLAAFHRDACRVDGRRSEGDLQSVGDLIDDNRGVHGADLLREQARALARLVA
mmetsp:Transcript_4091/g.8863  ORF Transcript_4091/g.8863 Transcript_4091/m.8863 type:complete len:235 (+) Transcript_4091:830-1534(+)